jgi:NADH:ubiquinone oxidoreductase subunit 2 (subunit N)
MSAGPTLFALLPWAAFAAPAVALLAALLIGLDALRVAKQPPQFILDADRFEVLPARVAVSAAVLALLCVLAATLGSLSEGEQTLEAAHWFGRIALSLKLDAAGLSFAVVIAAVAFAALRISRLYLHREAGLHRFLAGMCLLLAGMLLVALGGNAALVFVGWELAGFSSWLLIGYAWKRTTATENARYAFVTNRIGDAGFLTGLALCALWIGSLDWDGIATATDPLTVRLVCLAFLLAALVKSGQLPFSSWIARALEGPTPSSAVFYGALMVHAGAFLLIRIAPLLEQVPEIRIPIGLIGLATAVYAHLVARVQADIKSTLLFATLSQIGLIFLWVAAGWFTLATVHLAAHAAWRAWQFLLAPSALELAADPDHRTQHAPPPVLARLDAPLFSLALQRFHLDALADALLVQPLRAIGSDARRLDENVVAPAAGAPAALPPTLHGDPDDDAARERALIGSPGLVGRALFVVSERLQAFEARLLLQLGETPLTRLLHVAGEYLAASERLLEQPRYLLALVALTFVVIL